VLIYGENLAPTGFAAADLKKGGKAYDQSRQSKRAWSREQKRRSKLRNQPNCDEKCSVDRIGQISRF
jgi:hypothetical protein